MPQNCWLQLSALTDARTFSDRRLAFVSVMVIVFDVVVVPVGILGGFDDASPVGVTACATGGAGVAGWEEGADVPVEGGGGNGSGGKEDDDKSLVF
jgi:hypothetical protein